ncbi:MAG: hypothetical protein ACOC5F_03120 [Candidatus Aminicenantaceae bacterium]
MIALVSSEKFVIMSLNGPGVKAVAGAEKRELFWWRDCSFLQPLFYIIFF